MKVYLTEYSEPLIVKHKVSEDFLKEFFAELKIRQRIIDPKVFKTRKEKIVKKQQS
jgi:hypothetical protein